MFVSLTAEPDMEFGGEPIAYCIRCDSPIYDEDLTDDDVLDGWMNGYLCDSCKEEIEFYETEEETDGTETV